MKYIFTFGRNPELSLLELKSYLNSREIRHKFLEHSELAAVLELPELDFQQITKDLGGTIKIARVIRNDEPLYNGSKKKIQFAISAYSDTDIEPLKDEVKQRMKELKLKAMRKNSKRPLPYLSPKEVLKFNLLKEGFELIVFKEYVGKTIAIFNPKEVEERDLKRPKQRPKHMISIRLAKILINLSGATKDSVLLDPFCGYGIMLQEAMLMGMNVFGVDSSYDCVQATITNLKWIKQEYGIKKKSKVLKGDSQELSKFVKKADFVATEPYMGPLMKKLPTKENAEGILRELEPLYFNVLKELKKVVSNRIVFITPRFRLHDGKRKQLNFREMLKKASLKTMNRCPLIYTAPKSKIEREIWIITK